MHFPISGVDVSPVVPFLAGFTIASLTTPAGVSGAFLLLPFQVSVLGFVAPGVTPTNLVYNVISTPGGILRYGQQRNVDVALVRAIATGAVPGVIVGSVLRVTVFSDPGTFKGFVGVVLLVLGANIAAQAAFRRARPEPERRSFDARAVAALGGGAGVIGGIYGISGGSIIAPVLVGFFRLPVRRVAAAALVATLITSLAGVVSFEVLATVATTPDPTARPDWLLALFLGAGGALGGYAGARLNALLPELWLRGLLGALAVTLGALYVVPIL
jgi:hypothetical protein